MKITAEKTKLSDRTFKRNTKGVFFNKEFNKFKNDDSFQKLQLKKLNLMIEYLKETFKMFLW